MRTRLLGAALMLSCLLLVPGCGGDDDGGPNPVTGVDIAAGKANLEIGHSTEITAEVSGGDNKDLTWSVNGVENGNSEWGTITQNSSVTYNAPDALPSPRTVVIKAVSVEDTSKVDTCRVAVQFTKLFVDSATGDDDTATGCISLPYRTITRALDDATSGMTVLVKPGTYSDAAGELYPLRIYGEISLIGENWETSIIQKETATSNGVVAIYLAGDNGAVRKFTLRDKGEATFDRWGHAISTGQTGGLIDSIKIYKHTRACCFRIDGAQNTTIQNCVVNTEADDWEGNPYSRGFEIVFNTRNTIVRNCRVSGFGEALFFNYPTNALVEGCHLINNVVGAELCCTDSEESNPIPDFGGGARGSAGGNNIWGNSECGLLNKGTSTIYAKFNTWDNDPPIDGEDYCNQSTGSIVIE